ncbi:hydroxylase [Auraticoccus sp. F435]|uniref:Hydroxylase n=1 Tax=Auraticoccus cholistanensis TaxID=2656650 RepID=A0A6A9UX95_9ACTN|nr:hydroxylase [Auraticoccus cholistanensis]
MPSEPSPAADPSGPGASYSRGTVDLLGLVAYGELCAFERLAEDARTSPSLADKVQIAAMAAGEFGHFELVRDRLSALGVDAMEAMAPFRTPFDTFHRLTAPRSWLEGLVKTFVGDGFAADFYREVAAYVDADTRACVHTVLANEAQSDYIVARVRAGIAEDPTVAGRLALWGRRLVGEALSQAQRVAADRDDLTGLLAGTVDRPGMDLAAISRMFSRLVEAHTARMDLLGLAS